jgi:endonuclease III related protein
MKVLAIYNKLLKYFGPQGWWPIFDKKTENCKYFSYHNFRGRGSYGKYKNAFEICIGAILTQNTAWKNVERALKNLSLRALPVPRSFSEVGYSGRGNLTPQFILNCKNLETLIQPAGYYNQKAKKLRILSQWWLSRCHCEERTRDAAIPIKTRLPRSFQSLAMTEMRQELLSLWGIGPETADSILLYAFNQPVFVIDTYTKQLCKECGIEFKTYDEYRKFFEKQLPKSASRFNEYHALIVAWGKLHAKDRQAALKILK